MFTIPLPVSVWAIQNLFGISPDRSIWERQRCKGSCPCPAKTFPGILMCDINVELEGKSARGFVYNLGPVNLVAVVTGEGMVGCGAFDVAALEKFNYPAARVRPASGPSIASIPDLLAGIIKDANGPAQKRGVKVGMTGREALGRL
jgi:uncharacterized protein YunC (DUF1805 family)